MSLGFIRVSFFGVGGLEMGGKRRGSTLLLVVLGVVMLMVSGLAIDIVVSYPHSNNQMRRQKETYPTESAPISFSAPTPPTPSQSLVLASTALMVLD